MAKDKNSFLVYSNWEQTFENLNDEEAGRLIKHLFRYVNDREPIPPDRITELVFEPLKAVLKVDLKKYKIVCEEKSLQGRLGNLKRWHNDLFLLVENKSITLEEAEEKAVNRKTSVSDKNIANAIKTSLNIADNVNDNGNDNVNDILITTNSEIINFDDAVNICLFSEQWKEDVERLYKIDIKNIHLALQEFKLHCGTTGDNKPRSLNQFKKHFTNWVRVKKQYQIKAK